MFQLQHAARPATHDSAADREMKEGGCAHRHCRWAVLGFLVFPSSPSEDAERAQLVETGSQVGSCGACNDGASGVS